MSDLSIPVNVKNDRNLQVLNPWGLLPPLGNLQAYLTAVYSLPLLTADEEKAAAQKWQNNQDLDAAGRLVLSHLRLVVSISRQYLGYGLPHEDLIQEGNIGLMKAVKRFDPDQGVRLVSYAMHWIKAEIHEYVIKNWRMVKMVTTKAQRKLFFGLRSFKQELHHDETTYRESNHHRLSDHQVGLVADSLQVKASEVREMEARFAGGDIALDNRNDSDDTESNFGPIDYLADNRYEPSAWLMAAEQDSLSTQGVEHALETLDIRARTIITERWLKVNDDGSGGKTLHDLAAEFGVSAERIRQIESAALKKMRTVLTQKGYTKGFA